MVQPYTIIASRSNFDGVLKGYTSIGFTLKDYNDSKMCWDPP